MEIVEPKGESDSEEEYVRAFIPRNLRQRILPSGNDPSAATRKNSSGICAIKLDATNSDVISKASSGDIRSIKATESRNTRSLTLPLSIRTEPNKNRITKPKYEGLKSARKRPRKTENPPRPEITTNSRQESEVPSKRATSAKLDTARQISEDRTPSKPRIHKTAQHFSRYSSAVKRPIDYDRPDPGKRGKSGGDGLNYD